ncbi:hypothetical protein Aperf_G00000066405 [Anoplocephala perfoliata]
MQRRPNPDQNSSAYDANRYQTDSSRDFDYSAWLPGDGRISSDMPPYQMNCGQMEASVMDPHSGIYHENQPRLSLYNTSGGSVSMIDPGESVYCGSTSPDDFDYGQSYRRLIQNVEYIRGEINFKQSPDTYMRSQENGEFNRTPSPKQGCSQGSGARKSLARDFDMEKELRRLRNNEASRRSRRERKRRFLEIERRVEEMKASNRRLSEFLQELDSIIDEAKTILLTVNPNESFQPPFPARESDH